MHTKEKILHLTHTVARKLGKATQSNPYRWTQYFVLAISVFFMLGDVVLPLVGESGFTEVLKSWAFGKGFVLAWIWGVLAGHLFLYRKKEARILDEVLAISILVVISLILLCIACFYDLDGYALLNLILLAGGCIAGHYLWPQLPPEGPGEGQQN